MNARTFALPVICALFLLLGLFSLNDMLMYSPDSARYLSWAESLARLDGFKDTMNPEPTRYVVHAPLYPILLTPAALLAPRSVIAAKGTTLLFGLLVLVLFHRWLKRILGETEAAIGAFLLAVNPLMLIYSTQVLSDVPFAACVIVFLSLTERLARQPESHGMAEAGLVAVIIAGIFLREVGLTLMLGGAGCFLLLKQYRRASIIVLAAMMVYALWFIRNEVIIAPLENPPMRNMHLYFTHSYTSRDTPLFVELATRLWSNASVYAGHLGKLVLFPDLIGRTSSLISPTDPLVQLVFAAMPVGRYLLPAVAIAAAGIGIWHAGRTWKGFPITLVFLLFYTVPILLYPVNDIRFLLPILLLAILYISFGIRQIRQWSRMPGLRYAMMIGAFAVLIPNLVWMQSFVRNNSEYRSSPGEFSERIAATAGGPEQFTKPLHLAAQWIAANSESRTIVLTNWKELACWLDGRTVIDADPQMTPDVVDTYIRNYGISFLVSMIGRDGLREHEVLLTQSRRYTFESVHRVANVEVFRIHGRGSKSPVALSPVNRADSIRREFACALDLLDGGKPAEAETLFTRMAVRFGRDGNIIFHIGVAKEFAGHLDQASQIFARFRYIEQAGAHIQQTWYHQEMIARLRAAMSAPSRHERADQLHIVAINRWEVGFRREALRMLGQSVNMDSSFYPAKIFAAVFSYKLGEYAASQEWLGRAALDDPGNLLTVTLREVLAVTDSLGRATEPARRVALLLHRAQALTQMDLREDAADDLQMILAKDPGHRQALRLFGDYCFLKQHAVPAFRAYAALEASGPVDPNVRERLVELRRRFE